MEQIQYNEPKPGENLLSYLRRVSVKKTTSEIVILKNKYFEYIKNKKNENTTVSK